MHKPPVLLGKHWLKANEQKKKKLWEMYLPNFLGFAYMYRDTYLHTSGLCKAFFWDFKTSTATKKKEAQRNS